jgi:predicted alpha/beta hydrolase family esterase
MLKKVTYKKINSTNIRDKRSKQKILHLFLETVWLFWPSIIEKLVHRLFFSPVNYHLNDSEKLLLSHGKPFQIIVHNKKIQCWRWGKGPTVILAHGWNGRGVQFQPLIDPMITANFTVITYDAPAHGNSQGKKTNYFEFTDTLRTLWQSCKDENVVAVVGHSLGAAALINFISKEKFTKNVVLFAPPLKIRELLFQTFDQHGVPKIVYQNLIQNLEPLYGYNLFKDNPAQLIKNIKNDILIIHDKNDKAAPFADSEHAAELYDNITLHATVGLGHNRLLNDDSIIKTVLGYLERRKNITRNIQKAS